MLTLSGIVSLFGLVRAIVETVEATHEGVPGPDKKRAVLDALRAAWPPIATLLGFTAPIGGVVAVAGVLIDVIVGIYNARGYFKKAAVKQTTTTTVTYVASETPPIPLVPFVSQPLTPEESGP